jgi:hypothetical protein
MDEFQFISLNDKKYSWNTESKINAIPASFCSTAHLCEAYFIWLTEESSEKIMIGSVQADSFFTNCLFNYLFCNNLLKEDQPLKLSGAYIDHDTFNKICLQWLDQNEKELDLEAFLNFIKNDKQFWSDELLKKILDLRLNILLTNKFDLTVFWELLRFKINPNSIHLKSIPQECKVSNYQQLNFDSIIQFRKLIRKIPSATI